MATRTITIDTNWTGDIYGVDITGNSVTYDNTSRKLTVAGTGSSTLKFHLKHEQWGVSSDKWKSIYKTINIVGKQKTEEEMISDITALFTKYNRIQLYGSLFAYEPSGTFKYSDQLNVITPGLNLTSTTSPFEFSITRKIVNSSTNAVYFTHNYNYSASLEEFGNDTYPTAGAHKYSDGRTYTIKFYKKNESVNNTIVQISATALNTITTAGTCYSTATNDQGVVIGTPNTVTAIQTEKWSSGTTFWYNITYDRKITSGVNYITKPKPTGFYSSIGGYLVMWISKYQFVDENGNSPKDGEFMNVINTLS